MNAALEPVTVETQLTTVLPLLREYGDKLRRLLDAAANSPQILGTPGPTPKHIPRIEYLIRQFRVLKLGCEKIAMSASALLEHADLDSLTFTELKLRLDEIELALIQGKKIFEEKNFSEL